MLKWTVQQKRQKASVVVDDTHEPAETSTMTAAAIAADCSGCGGGSCDASSRSDSECGSLGEEHQQQVMVTVTPSDGGGIPSQQCPCSPPTPTLPLARPRSCVLPRCDTPSPTQTEAADADRAGGAPEAVTCDAEDAEPAAAAFVRRASVRQPRVRQARPLSLNLDTLYGCDRAAIPQKAKALLGIDERPRTPVVVAVTTAAGLVDRLTTVSPKAMAVLGLTAAESQHAVEQQQQQSRQRLSQLRRRREPPASSSRQLQQISECAAATTPVDGADPGAAAGGSSRGAADGWSGSSSSSGSTSDGGGSSSSGQMPPAGAATAVYALAGDDRVSEQRGYGTGCMPWHHEVTTAAAAAVATTTSQPCSEHRCALSCGPSPGGAIVAAPRQSLVRTECVNEVAELMAARPKVARRRPLKQHSRKEVVAKSVSSAAPRTAVSELLGADDDADEGCGGSGACGSGKPAARRCGSCTPDSGVGGLNGQSAEHDSPSEDDAIAAWKQPSPVTSAGGGSLVYGGSTSSCGVGRHSPLPLPLRALCSPPGGAHCDFIDIDILLGAGGPAVKALPEGSCRLHGSGCGGGSGYSSLPTPDDCHRQPLQQQRQRRQRAAAGSCGTPPPPLASPHGSGELRHAHSDPASWASSSSAMSAASTVGEVPCALEQESMRWAAMRANSGYYHLQTANGRSGRSTQGHSAERKAAIAAFRKTVHVYC